MIYIIEENEGNHPDPKQTDRRFISPSNDMSIEEKFYSFSDGNVEYAYLRLQELKGGKAVIIHLAISCWLPSIIDSLKVDFSLLLRLYDRPPRLYVGGYSDADANRWVTLLASVITLIPINKDFFQLETI